jgi:hypothetical protein
MLLRKGSRCLVLFASVMTVSVGVFAQQAMEFRITASEFSFKPSSIQVPRGEIRITVINRGKFLHGLAIVGRDEKIRTSSPVRPRVLRSISIS